MELQLLAEIANDIFGTGQVFSAGRKLDTTQRDSRERRKGVAGPDMLVLQWCVCFCVCVGNCVTILVRAWSSSGHRE